MAVSLIAALAPAPLKSAEPVTQSSATAESKPSEPKPQAAEGVPRKPVVSPIISVKLALMADARLFPYEIDVDVKGAEVALAGKVSSEQEKTAAGEVAQGVPGIKSVLNRLEIVKELGQILARKRDERVTEDIKIRFERSKTLKTVGFEVKTENGVVFLGGKTRFQVIVLEAAESARGVPGVKAVRTDGVRLEAEE